MTDEKIICLHSKFSKYSKNLLYLVQNKLTFIKFICIDNNKVRKRILNDKKLNVTTVPCILVVFSTGIVEKYEGEAAFYLGSRITEQNRFKRINKNSMTYQQRIAKEQHIQQMQQQMQTLQEEKETAEKKLQITQKQPSEEHQSQIFPPSNQHLTSISELGEDISEQEDKNSSQETSNSTANPMVLAEQMRQERDQVEAETNKNQAPLEDRVGDRNLKS